MAICSQHRESSHMPYWVDLAIWPTTSTAIDYPLTKKIHQLGVNNNVISLLFSNFCFIKEIL